VSGVPEDGGRYIVTLICDGDQIGGPRETELSVSTENPDIDDRPFQLLAWAPIPEEWSDPIAQSPLRHPGDHFWTLDVDGIGMIPVTPTDMPVGDEVQVISLAPADRSKSARSR
jgi:hypothetical protein